MSIKIKGKGWGMTISGHKDCVKLILKKRDSAEIRAQIPKAWWAQAEADLGIKKDRQEREDALCAKIGLIKQGSFWKIPDGFIAVHLDGIADEHASGFFRRPDGISAEENKDGTLRIVAKMVDTEGFGVDRQIVGILPEPKNPEEIRQHWTDRKDWEEIQKILQADEAGE